MLEWIDTLSNSQLSFALAVFGLANAGVGACITIIAQRRITKRNIGEGRKREMITRFLDELANLELAYSEMDNTVARAIRGHLSAEDAGEEHAEIRERFFHASIQVSRIGSVYFRDVIEDKILDEIAARVSDHEKRSREQIQQTDDYNSDEKKTEEIMRRLVKYTTWAFLLEQVKARAYTTEAKLWHIKPFKRSLRQSLTLIWSEARNSWADARRMKSATVANEQDATVNPEPEDDSGVKEGGSKESTRGTVHD